MIINKFLFPILFLLSVFQSHGQAWQWDWGVQASHALDNTWTNFYDCDFENNLYVGTQYQDSLFVGDTLLTHPGYYPGWSNWAIAKYNNRGKFSYVIDIYTIPLRLVLDVKLVTDPANNLYIAGQFQDTVFVMDSLIQRGSFAIPMMPDLFLAKLAPDLSFEWVHLITSRPQDECLDLVYPDDGYLYMATRHGGFSGDTDTVVYMGQDTALVESSLASLLKISPDGTLVWRKTITGPTTLPYIRTMKEDPAGFLSIFGWTWNDIYYENDTIFHPQPGPGNFGPFFLQLDLDGNLTKGFIKNWSLVLSDVSSDTQGNLYFSGGFSDTLIFGGDTLIETEDSTIQLLGKLDANMEPIWYKTIRAKSSQGAQRMKLKRMDDTLFFAADYRGNFLMFDSLYDVGQYEEVMVGKSGPDGNLMDLIRTNSLWGFTLSDFATDNCDQLILTGKFRGTLDLGKDTLESQFPGLWDGVLVKLDRHDPFPFTLGIDTTVCDSVVLLAPEGLAAYYWNGTATGNPWYLVTEDGIYSFTGVSEGGCWITDTLQVTVQPGFSINLGADTAIAADQILTIILPDEYDAYLWSTGDTSNILTISGAELGEGTWQLWALTTVGVCSASDTLNVTVYSGMGELEQIGIKLYPNPVKDHLNMTSESQVDRVVLSDLSGTVLLNLKPPGRERVFQVDLSGLPPGIYIVKIILEDWVAAGRLVKL